MLGKKNKRGYTKLVYFWRGFSSKKSAGRIDRWIYNPDISLPSSSETSHKRARPSTTSELRSSLASAIHMTIMFLNDNVSFLSRVCRPNRAWLFSRTLHRGRTLAPLHKSRNTRNGKCWNRTNLRNTGLHRITLLTTSCTYLIKCTFVWSTDQTVTRIPEPRPWQLDMIEQSEIQIGNNHKSFSIRSNWTGLRVRLP